MEEDISGDPWWWSSSSAFPAPPSPDEAFYDAKTIIASGAQAASSQQPQVKLLPGEAIYRYGLTRELSMESVQVAVEGYEAKNPLQIEELRVTVQLVGLMGELLKGASVSTSCSSSKGPKRVGWGEHLLFPFKISDLPEDAALHFCIWSPPLNSYSFSETLIGGAIFPLFSREGLLRTGKQEIEIYPDCLTPDKQTPAQREEEAKRAWSITTVEYEKEEAKRKLAHRSEMTWLNQLAEVRLSQVRRARRSKLPDQVLGLLSVELVDYGVPIVYEPEEDEPSANPSGYVIDDYDGRPIHTGSEVVFSEIPAIARSETFRNVVEGKAYAMRRSLTRKSAGDDPHLRPNVDERDQIERILNSLSKPGSEEEDLLWKFRHSLVRNSKALTKVLASVKWESDDEVNQVTKLLDKWEAAQVSDVLRLLSGEVEFSHPVVRTYAVKVLSHSGNSVLLLYMPQLVQALRYDSVGAKRDGETVSAGPLQAFLVTKCCSNEELASSLHWFLKVECALGKTSNPQNLEVFQPVFEYFRNTIAKHPNVQRAIQTQDEFVGRIMGAARAAASVSGKHTEKTKVLLHALEQEDRGNLHDPIPLAGFPGKRIIRMKRETARIMKSTTSPAVIDFVVQNVHDPTTSATAPVTPMDESIMSSSKSTLLTKEPQSIRIMFKVGDDLRQDQLIIQLIELMDNIFRDNGLDLEMTIYHVLATAPREGLIEFIPDAIPLSKVMNDYGSILLYLNKEEHLHGGKKAVIERFIRSCAGYAVATYVLGIGDRHLDNIMLKPNGHMFHIDFGYAFGRDPKLFSVPVRMLPQMMDAMGGEGEKNFRRHCWEALKALRGQAALILSVIGLMVDASIPDLSKLQMPTNVFAGIQERLKLGISDEEAEKSLNTIIDQSIVALGPRLNEKIHQLAQQFI